MVNERPTHDPLPPPPLPHMPGGAPPRLLANRPFLWYGIAEGVSGIALWSYFLAVMGDAAFRLGATPGQIGILLAWFSIVFIPAAPAFGALADRWRPLRMIQFSLVGLAGAVVLTSTAASMRTLYASMAVVGLMQGVVWPARGALTPRLVPKDRLVQANGMLGAAREIPMVLGPAIAGLAVGLWGRRGPYLVALVALALALAVSALIPDRRAEGPPERSFLRDLAEGTAAAMRVPVLRLLIAIGAGVMFTIGVLQTLEPLFVKEVLRRGQDALGFLWSMQGLGAFLASAALVRLARRGRHEMRLVASGVVLGGLGFLLYVATGSYAVAIPGLVLLGAGYGLFFASAQALIQRISANPGKVSSLFIVIAEIGPLIAALGIGALGSVAVRPWLVGSAAAFIALGLVSLWAARRPSFLGETERHRAAAAMEAP